MHRLISKYLAFLLLISLFLPACQREREGAQETVVPMEGEWKAIPYRATVSSSAKTKATLDAIDVHYIFERDDLLYVVDKTTEGNVLYGYLYLTSGAGSRTAVFEGDLMFFVKKSTDPDVYEPERPANSLVVTATLVSKTQRDNGVYTFVTNNEGKIDTGPNFGDKYASTFKEAVQKYSTFTADATYGNPSFSLVQGTTFLLFSLSFDDTVAGPLTISVTNNNGADNLFSHSVTPDGNHEASFVAAFPGGTITLNNAKLNVTGFPAKSLASFSLQGNHYYNVVKTFLDLSFFTIQAREAATTISFPTKYQDAAYALQYSSDGEVWTSVSVTPSFELTAGSSVKVRGKGSIYQYSDGTTPLFTSSAPCYIYGDIMSLFCDGSYNKKNAFSNNNALNGTFKNMTNLDIHPARPLLLSAQTLRQECYLEMFAGSSITRAPEFNNEGGLYAASVPTRACKWMFKDCVGLTAAPELPATSMGQESYYGMFSGCTAMETPPSRLAGTMSGSSACRQMFLGCSSLLYAPELPATDIKANGYREMFAGCTSLTEAPELPATTVNDNSYQSMFGAVTIDAVAYSGCTSMVTGPSSLPATNTNKSSCYRGMFTGCSSLETAPAIAATGTLGSNCFQDMFSGCSMLRNAQDSFSFTTIGNYSCKMMFYNCLVLTAAPDMSSVTGTIGTEGCREMYSGCEALSTGPDELNATNVGVRGYYGMFYNCKKLQTAPASLPATTLGNQCYYQMFQNCKKLTSAPSFPGEKGTLTGTQQCYQMFNECTSLTTASGKLFTSDTELVQECFHGMFRHCTALNTVPEDFLPSLNMATQCYRGMFEGAAFTTAPTLPAPKLVSECYRYMFYNCSNLNEIKCLARYSISGNTPNFTTNVAASGTFTKYKDVSWPSGNAGIPFGWTVVEVTE